MNFLDEASELLKSPVSERDTAKAQVLGLFAIADAIHSLAFEVHRLNNDLCKGEVDTEADMGALLFLAASVRGGLDKVADALDR